MNHIVLLNRKEYKYIIAFVFFIFICSCTNFVHSQDISDSLSGSEFISVIDSVSQITPAQSQPTTTSVGAATVTAQAGGISVLSVVRGLMGIVIILIIAWLFSNNKKAVSWRIIFRGVVAQVLLAFGVLQFDFIRNIIEFIGKLFIKVLDFTKEGSIFLLGDLMDSQTYGFIFVFQILPTIIFFSALTSVLFHYGIIQFFVKGLAWIMIKAMKLSGAESLSVAGNIFLGQTESPLMIKAYLEKMNKSEILLVMTGGMATIAGGVMALYIEFLGGIDPTQKLLFAKHLITASVMAAPGAVVISKILVPQTESVDQSMQVKMERSNKNILDAMSSGTADGLRMAANVGAMLLVFVAFIAMFNFIATKIGFWTGLNTHIDSWTNGSYKELSLQFMLGYLFAPLMWLIGVCKEDMTLLGSLLGEKIIMSELIAYKSLAGLKVAEAFTQGKSVIMATYMLCGFANFASIGIQIGGIGALAPNQKHLLAKYGLKALIGGTLASLLSATIVGMILG